MPQTAIGHEHERDFWNEHVRITDEYMLKRFQYVIDEDFVPLGHPWPDSRNYLFGLAGAVDGQTILDIGCGSGWASVVLARKNAKSIVAIDVSDKMLEFVNKIAKVNSVGDLIQTVNVPVESADFADNSFDLIVSLEVLHHVDVEKTMQKIHGWLKPGGRAVFAEPLANSRFLRALRDLSPVAKFGTATERGLTMKEILAASMPFSAITYRQFQFLTRLERVFRNARFSERLLAIDSKLLQVLPFLRYFARIVVFRVVK